MLVLNADSLKSQSGFVIPTDDHFLVSLKILKFI